MVSQLQQDSERRRNEAADEFRTSINTVGQNVEHTFNKMNQRFGQAHRLNEERHNAVMNAIHEVASNAGSSGGGGLDRSWCMVGKTTLLIFIDAHRLPDALILIRNGSTMLFGPCMPT